MNLLKTKIKLILVIIASLAASPASFSQETQDEQTKLIDQISDSSMPWDTLEEGTIQVDIEKIKNFGLPTMYSNFKGMTKKTDSEDSKLVEFTTTCDSYLAQVLKNSSGSVIQHPKNTSIRSNEILFSPDCKTAYLFPPVNNLLILNGTRQFGSTTEGQCRQLHNKAKTLKIANDSLEQANLKKSEVFFEGTAESTELVRRLDEELIPDLLSRIEKEEQNLAELSNARAASFGLTTISGFNSDLIHNYADANPELLKSIPDFQFKLAPIQRGTIFVSDQSESNTEESNINNIRDVLNTTIPGYIPNITESNCSNEDENCLEEERKNQSQKIAESLNGTSPLRLILTRAWVCDTFYTPEEGISNKSAKDQTDVISNLTSVTWSYGVAMSTNFEIKATINMENLIDGFIKRLRKYQKNWTDEVVNITKADINITEHTTLEIETPFIGMGIESSDGYREYLKMYEDQVWNHITDKVMQTLEDVKFLTGASDVQNVGSAEDLKGGQKFRTEVRQKCKKKWYGSRKCWPVKINIPYNAETSHSMLNEVKTKFKSDISFTLKKNEVVTYGQNSVFMNKENLDEAIDY